MALIAGVLLATTITEPANATQAQTTPASVHNRQVHPSTHTKPKKPRHKTGSATTHKVSKKKQKKAHHTTSTKKKHKKTKHKHKKTKKKRKTKKHHKKPVHPPTPVTPAPPLTPDPVTPPTPVTPPSPTGVHDLIVDRAMWLWNWDNNQDVLNFSLAHHVKEIFTYAYPGFSTDTTLSTKLADLTSRATAAGIRMWAMGGDPSWVTNPQAALNWEHEVITSGYFNGIHLEIEPHSEDGYWDNQDTRNYDYIHLLTAMHAAKGTHTLELSLPWWYHTIAYGATTLDVAAISAVDQITIVTFNDTADGIITDTEHAAAAAHTLNKPYRLASETNPVDLDWVTFNDQPSTDMLTIQNQVSIPLLSDPLYRGFAIEDYTGWAGLPT